MIIYSHREDITSQRKGRKAMNYYINNIETSMEYMIENALAEMEKKGEKLPEIRYGEEE
jgi:hypothetical protein